MEALLVCVTTEKALVELFREGFSCVVSYFFVFVDGYYEIHKVSDRFSELPRVASHNDQAAYLNVHFLELLPKCFYGDVLDQTNVLFRLELKFEIVIISRIVPSMAADMNPHYFV